MTCGRFVAGLYGKHSQGLALCLSKSRGYTQLFAFLGTTLHITNLKKTSKIVKNSKNFHRPSSAGQPEATHTPLIEGVEVHPLNYGGWTVQNPLFYRVF